MDARGDNGIPADALAQEAYVLARGVGNPPEMATQAFLSAIRQERLLLRLCEAMEKLANRSKPGPKPKAKRG